MNNSKILCILLGLNINFIFAYDIHLLSSLTKLSEDMVIDYMNQFQGIEDWNETPIDYYLAFPKLINAYNLKIGCEVGVATGGNSYSILKNTNVEKLYSVDPFAPELYPSFATEGILELFFLRIKFRLGEFGNRSEMIRMYSLPAAHLFNDEELDFVFIDADHSYEATKQDIEIWYKKVKSGGIIGGDDYATIWPGVPQAVNEFFQALELVVNTDKDAPRVWWVQKP